MTVTSTVVRTVTGVGNGINLTHVIGFPFQANSHIEVYLQNEGVTPYTLTLMTVGAGAGQYGFTGGDPGLNVVTVTALTATQRLIIKRVTPRQQNVDYVGSQAFPADDHEEQMDRQTMMEQEDTDEFSRMVSLWPTQVGFDPRLPSDIATPDALLKVNAAGDGWETGPALTALGGIQGPPGADGLNAPVLLWEAPTAGARDGVNQDFTLANNVFVTSNAMAVLDGVIREVATYVGATVTVSPALAAELADLAIDLKFLYIKG